MKTKSKLRANRLSSNHSATKSGVKIKSNVRAGKLAGNHNATKRS
jgi:hypothetical protein